MLTAYHNHSIWSDGEDTVEVLVARARALGIDQLGISDHYTLHPSSERVEWAMAPDMLNQYVVEVLGARAAFDTPEVRLGIEADYFHQTIDAVRSNLAAHPFDYVIGSIHYAFDGMSLDSRADLWESRTPAERAEIWRRYWEQVAALARSGVFDIVGHMDLPKIFGDDPGAPLDDLVALALDAVAEAGMAVELNTAGWRKPCAEQYPSADLLRLVFERDIPLVVTSDAHIADDLIRDVDISARSDAPTRGQTGGGAKLPPRASR